MFIPKINNAFFLRRKYLEILLYIFIVLPVVYFVSHGYLHKLAVLCLLSTSVLIAYRVPFFTVFTLIIFAILPSIFQMVPGYSEGWTNLGGGIRIQDVIIASMLVAVFLKLFFPARGKPSQNQLGLSVPIIIFGLWILFEIARNVGTFGLSAPGEFRYRYLILSVPLYVALFFSLEKERKKLFKLLIASALFFPIFCIPIIGHLKGWSVGAESRFFPSSISLGLLYGVIALNLGQKYNLVKISGVLSWFMFASAGLLLLLDSHRSVWITALAIGLILFWVKQIQYRKVMTWSLLIIISVMITYVVASKFIMSSVGITLFDFILERSSDIAKFSEGYDNTAAWRVAQWKAQMVNFYAAPIAGEGFGGYWGLSGKLGDLGVSPHSLYVQTLIKLGSVGLILYLIIVARIFIKLKRTIEKYKTRADPEMAILVTGMVILIASHVFYSVYAFEYYSLLFIGLSVASLRDEKFTI